MTELDRLYDCIKSIAEEEVEGAKLAILAHRFRLPSHTSIENVLAHLVALNTIEVEMPIREPNALIRVLNMRHGDNFTLNNKVCVFLDHYGAPTHVELPPNGFFEYRYLEDIGIRRGLDYDVAWSAVTDGALIVW